MNVMFLNTLNFIENKEIYFLRKNNFKIKTLLSILLNNIKIYGISRVSSRILSRGKPNLKTRTKSEDKNKTYLKLRIKVRSNKFDSFIK
jgi:hypothetical protein